MDSSLTALLCLGSAFFESNSIYKLVALPIKNVRKYF